MKDYTTTWSKAEFKAYLLLCCASADFIETNEEKELIISKIDVDTYKRIHKEFDEDSDFEKIQKIASTAERHQYSEEQIGVLLEEMKSVFLSDGSYDILEKNLFLGLRRILK